MRGSGNRKGTRGGLALVDSVTGSRRARDASWLVANMLRRRDGPPVGPPGARCHGHGGKGRGTRAVLVVVNPLSPRAKREGLSWFGAKVASSFWFGFPPAKGIER